MTKRKKDKDIPLLEGQRSLVGFFSPPAKHVPVTESALPASLKEPEFPSLIRKEIVSIT